MEKAEEGPVTIIRYRVGVVGERKRTFHLVSWDASGEAQGSLVARCGEKFEADLVEQLSAALGMPCERCMASTNAPGADVMRAALEMMGRGAHGAQGRLAG